MMAFRDRPIITKMRLMTVVILILFTAALAILFGTYWLLGTRREAEISLRERTETSALSLDQLMRSVTEGVVSACGTEDFALKMTDMIDASIEPTRLRVMLQEELTRLATSSSAIESALIVDTETEKARRILGWEAARSVEDMCRSAWSLRKERSAPSPHSRPGKAR